MIVSVANLMLEDNNSIEKQNGTLSITDSESKVKRNITYESAGKCLEVIDGNTIRVYGVGTVQLSQVKIADSEDSNFTDAKKFVEDRCLGKTVYLNIDDVQPTDRYGRTLAIVYSDSEDINRELVNSNLGEISYFSPSEFKKGDI